jgi:hypothetical protein
MLIARLTVVGLSFLLLGGAAQAPQEQRFVVLPSHSVPTISARVMDDVDSHGSWEPATADIEGLERSLSRVSELKVTGWTSKTRIEHPERYFRQYIGVSHRNQRRIYINAFCDDPPPSDWRSHLYVVVDGATCYWQALYDPSTKSFSNLTINARA